MKVTSGNGSKRVTTDDRLWMLRAVQAEGEPRRDVAQALVNLWMAAGKGSLASLVRAYAQPVNPRWYLSGDLHKKAASEASSAARLASLESAARKREQFHSTRTVFDRATHDAVEWALSGQHATDVTDYAAAWVDAARKGYQPRTEAVRGVNRMWTRLPGWRGYTVDGSNVLPIVCLMVALMWGAYAY